MNEPSGREAIVKVLKCEPKKHKNKNDFLVLTTDVLGDCTCQAACSGCHDDLIGAFDNQTRLFVRYTESGLNPRTNKPYVNIIAVDGIAGTEEGEASRPPAAAPAAKAPAPGPAAAPASPAGPAAATRAIDEAKAIRSNIALAASNLVLAGLVGKDAAGCKQAFELVRNYVDQGLMPYGSERP